MKNNTKLARKVSIFVLIGFPALFLILSLITGQWGYLAYSIAPSFLAGFTGLMITAHHAKKEVHR